MNNNDRSRPRKTALLLAQRIVSDISRRRLSAGDRLDPERAMLEQYQVGRGTLRESLRFLEFQGVISLKPGPGGGPTVEKPDASMLATSLLLLLQFEKAPFRSIVDTRVQLEPMMAYLAAERMTDEQMKKLSDSVETMSANLNDRHVFLESNKRFHDVIAWSSGNPVFGFLVDALLGILDGTALGVDYPIHRRTAVLKAHTGIYQALESGDPRASEEAMRTHVSEYSRYVSRKFPEAIAQPITWDLV